ncbi:MAG: hypothetical protein FWC76_00485 [Defluviitaleaceae bacterium]|nr:hypothetical protein [Defluviitaleaceae bacterium]
MFKKRHLRYLAILCFTVIAVTFGAALLYAQSDDDVFEYGEGHYEAYGVHNTHSIIDTLSAECTPLEAIARWVGHGVFPAIDESDFDVYITYSQFAEIMDGLLRYPVDEKYIFNSGHMYIRRHEAYSIISEAFGKDSFAYESGFITFSQLAIFLNSFIQIYIADETTVNLSEIYLQGYMVINPSRAGFDMLVTNVEGPGSIAIASGRGGRILFNNVDIADEIIVAKASEGLVNLTLNNSSVRNVRFLGDGMANLINATYVDIISFYGLGAANTSLLAYGAPLPNIQIDSPNARLSGSFDSVKSSLHNEIIFVSGEINSFYSAGNMILVGTGEIEYINVSDEYFVIIIDPSSPETGLTDELKAFLEALFLRNFENLELSLDVTLSESFTDFRADFPTINVPHAPPPTIITVPGPSPSPAPSPAPSPTPGPGSQLPQPPDPNRIDIIQFEIMPPNLLPAHLLPGNLTGNAQWSVVGNGFTGAVRWLEAGGNVLAGNIFAANTVYIAEITLTPLVGRHFGPNPSVHVATVGNVWHDRTNLQNDIFTSSQVVFSIIFDATGKLQASQFTLREIEGPFNQVHVYTHDLGAIAASNFLVHFGDVLNPSDRINVSSVSSHSPGGYYVITLAETLPPDGRRLYVEIVGTLPFHEPYPNAAHITPTQAPSTTPSLITTSASIGGTVLVSNFPSDFNYEVYLSLTPINDTSYLLQTTQAVPAFDFNPALQSFTLPVVSSLGPHFVYIVNMLTGTVEQVGVLIVV